MSQRSKLRTAPKALRGPEVAHAFFEAIAEVFVQPLQAQGLVRHFTTNTAVLGDYAEAWIRQVATAMLPGLRVSTGTIVRPTDEREGAGNTPQVDILLWDPSWMPAVFECGDFAIVHTQAVKGVIEVKRSLKIGERARFREGLLRRRSRLLHEARANVLGVVVAAGRKSDRFLLDWVPEEDMDYPTDPAIVRLLDSRYQRVDVDGVHSLIHLLRRIARTPDPKVM